MMTPDSARLAPNVRFDTLDFARLAPNVRFVVQRP
jgi:hypothetical protein